MRIAIVLTALLVVGCTTHNPAPSPEPRRYVVRFYSPSGTPIRFSAHLRADNAAEKNAVHAVTPLTWEATSRAVSCDGRSETAGALVRVTIERAGAAGGHDDATASSVTCWGGADGIGVRTW